MSTPSHSLRRSPGRGILQERTQSHTNEALSTPSSLSSSARSSIYQRISFPIPPSHILSPRTRRDRHSIADPSTANEEEGSLISEAEEIQDKWQERERGFKSPRHSPGSSVAAALASVVGRPSPPPRNPARVPLSTAVPTEGDGLLTFLEDDDDASSDEIIQLPSIGPWPERRESPSAKPNFTSSHPLDPSSSESSLASEKSTGTVVRSDNRTPGLPSDYPAPLRPSSFKSRASSSPTKPLPRLPKDGDSPRSPTATSKFSRRIASVPTHAQLAAVVHSGVNVQYPRIRGPSASGSWAESSNVSQKTWESEPRVSRRWNPRLSALQSEVGEDSGDKQKPGNSKTSSMAVNRSTAPPSPLLEAPKPALTKEGDSSRTKIKRVVESDRDVNTLPSPILQSNGAPFYEFLSRPPNPGEGRGVAAEAGPSFGDRIPSWVQRSISRTSSGGKRRRDRYKHFTLNSLYSTSGAPDSSTEASESRPLSIVSPPTSPTIPVGLFRPRNRPRQRSAGGAPTSYMDTNTSRETSKSTDSSWVTTHLALQPVRQTADGIVEVRGSPQQRSSPRWSPHLWRDKKAAKRQMTFTAPGVDELAESSTVNRRMAQIVLFAVGFAIPLAWIVAALLPLPPKPASIDLYQSGKNARRDLEKRVLSVDEARYENARWWRNINRTLAIVGLLVIGAIVSIRLALI